MWESLLNYFLTRFGFRSERKRSRDSVEDDVSERGCKQRKLSTSENRFRASDQFLCPTPNWRNLKGKKMASACQQQQGNVPKAGCSWFEDIIDISDDEDLDVVEMWQNSNAQRKHPGYNRGIVPKESNTPAAGNKADGSDDIEVVKVVESHKKQIERSGNNISIFQTPSTRVSALSRLAVESTGSIKTPLLLPRLKTLHSKSSQGSSGSHSGTSTHSSRAEEKKKRLALYESFRLEEKLKYSELLQSLTNVPIQTVTQITSFSGSRSMDFRNIPRRDSNSQGKNIFKEVIDLTKPQNSHPVSRRKVELRKDREIEPSASTSKKDTDEPEIIATSFGRTNVKVNIYYDEDLVASINEKYKKKKEAWKKKEEEERLKAEFYEKRLKKLQEESLERLTNYMKITDAIYDDVSIEEKAELPELTPEMQKVIDSALIPKPADDVLITAFGLPIKRRDMHTLAGLNWLNDEIINYYMELLTERGKLENYPSVYSFNTFFYPRLLSAGYSAIKRWTRKVDIFSNELIIVPVHLGVHWCMAAIDLRNKTVKYYDSMGAANNKCLQALLKYLQDEHVDKKKNPFDTSGWQTENVQNIPQQMNGSDCGMFACTYAEFICRNASFTFTQEDMPYFRRKMVYEIYTRKLLL